MRRVAIAAGDPGYGTALALLVDGEPDLDYVGLASDVEGLVALIVARDAEVAAVDAGIPGGGPERLRTELDELRHRCRLVLLGAIETSAHHLAASRVGATFAPKADAGALLASLRAGPG